MRRVATRASTSEVTSLRCPSCGRPNRAAASFCGECATPLAVVSGCPRCAAPTRRGQRFCDACGCRLTGTDGAATAASGGAGSETVPEGERKTITALFADIKGSVALMEDLDPEDARAIVDPALALMIEAVRHFEGYVDRSTGDGVLALFGARVAHEDHAQRGVHAALRMQQEVARYAEKLECEKGMTLQIRVGLNSGEVVLRPIRTDETHTDYTPIGHVANLAARMESSATPGKILVGEGTYRLAKGFFQFGRLDPIHVKGVREPVACYEVVGLGPLRTRLDKAAQRGLARFVGRDGEMRHMTRALDLVKDGHGQIVAVVGEPGMGKSRLVHEFKQLAQEECAVLQTFAVTHGKAYACLPLIALLKDYFEIVAQNDERARREKVRDKLARLDGALADTLPYLYHLLGLSEPTASLVQMDPRIRRRRTFVAIKRLLVHESLRRPVVVIFEDLQWLDGETQAFLDVLSESVPTARILLLVNYRPEYRHAWSGRTYCTQLPLEPLAPDTAHEMLAPFLGEGAGLEPLKRLILEKSEGNPFFMEEIVQTLVDRGVILRGPAGPRLSGPLTQIEIPPTIQGVLAARIDCLGGEEKALLQRLAVIGREFPQSLLKEVAERPEDELQELLSHLLAAEFIYEQPALSEPQYTFKHALTREVAYGSLLMERRRVLHEQTAHAIESVFHHHLEDHFGELAHHYGCSGNRQKAVQYLRLAGVQAVQRSANAEAVAHLTAALCLLEGLPDTPERAQQELALQVALGAPLALIKGYAAPDVGATRTRARELCQRVGETPQLFPVLFGLWAFYLVRAELQTALQLSDQLLELARKAHDPALLVGAHRAAGPTRFFLGEFDLARTHLEEGIALYDRAHHGSDPMLYGQDPAVSCLSYLAVVLWHLGYPDEALRRSEEAVTLAQEIDHPFSLAFSLDMAAAVREFRREAQRAEERAEAAVTLSVEQGFPLWATYGAVLRGWALVEQGTGRESIAGMHQGLSDWRGTGARVVGPYLLALLAEACVREGRTDEGLAAVNEAMAMMETTGERWREAENHRLQGELLLQGPVVREHEAEACFRRAADVARRQNAKALELRAASSLSRLLSRRGEREKARRLLADLTGAVHGGSTTADLMEAELLLRELS